MFQETCDEPNFTIPTIGNPLPPTLLRLLQVLVPSALQSEHASWRGIPLCVFRTRAPSSRRSQTQPWRQHVHRDLTTGRRRVKSRTCRMSSRAEVKTSWETRTIHEIPFLYGKLTKPGGEPKERETCDGGKESHPCLLSRISTNEYIEAKKGNDRNTFK